MGEVRRTLQAKGVNVLNPGAKKMHGTFEELSVKRESGVRGDANNDRRCSWGAKQGQDGQWRALWIRLLGAA